MPATGGSGLGGHRGACGYSRKSVSPARRVSVAPLILAELSPRVCATLRRPRWAKTAAEATAAGSRPRPAAGSGGCYRDLRTGTIAMLSVAFEYMYRYFYWYLSIRSDLTKTHCALCMKLEMCMRTEPMWPRAPHASCKAHQSSSRPHWLEPCMGRLAPFCATATAATPPA